MDSFLFEQLFTTEAFELAPPDQPFWYTSGLLGPFYINTQYLFGGKTRANELLLLIEQAMETPERLLAMLLPAIKQELEDNSAFRQLMERAAAELQALEFDFISGGARRDFYFSIPLAYLMNKPHLSILKDGSSYYSEDLTQPLAQAAPELRGKKALHVADIITKASSFRRQWIPAVQATGAPLSEAFAILDRCQGGDQVLANAGARLHTLGQIDSSFLAEAQAQAKLSADDKALIELFLADEQAYLQTFIEKYPDFIPNTLNAGGKAAERARLAIEAGWIAHPDQ